jgi:Arc-like DNA binding domain
MLVAYRKSLVQVRFRLRKEALRKLESAAKRHDRSTNDELAQRLEESFQQKERAEVEEALLTQIALMPPEQIGGALIGLAALGGPMGRQMSMAAIRTEQGRAAALDWLSMAHRKSEEELREATRPRLAKPGPVKP